MKEFRVGAWVTVGGYVTVEAKNLEEAEHLVEEMIAEDEVKNFIQHPTFKVTHRDFETLGEI